MALPKEYRLTRELLLNDLAIRSFRDIADQDYIAARLAYHSRLPQPSLWQSQQALEKYFKCILLLHRVVAKDVGHNLTTALDRVQNQPSIGLALTPITKDFIAHIDMYGAERYLTFSSVAYGHDIVRLDRAVWELRRFCTLDLRPRQLALSQGKRPKRYSIGGWLEEVLAKDSETRRALTRENGFWGSGRKTRVSVPGWITATNAPLHMHPEILSLALKYIRIPRDLASAYENHKAPGLYVPEEGVEMSLKGLTKRRKKMKQQSLPRHHPPDAQE